MVAMALLGVFFSYAGLPRAPFILGFILGPMLENNLRKGLTYTADGFLSFFTRPVSGALLTIAILSLFWPAIRERIEQKRAARSK